MRKLSAAWAIVLCCGPFGHTDPAAETKTDVVPVRGHVQSVHVYGAPGARPIIVSSGDGGWIHLGPHVAHVLAAHGCFVLGFDVKAYLESFTSGTNTLTTSDAPGDYRTLSQYVAQGSQAKPILVGVSEGAGLSMLAAADPLTRQSIAGVIGIGLPDRNELGWRWKDSVIYLTHGVPNEPTFSAAALMERLSAVPVALMHSTHDEFVPLSEAQRMLALDPGPKQLWVIRASDHRFSDNLVEFDQRLLDAVDWITQHEPHPPS
jgi:pimeloyl-ACP methyl ester carboxylesterase